MNKKNKKAYLEPVEIKTKSKTRVNAPKRNTKLSVKKENTKSILANAEEKQATLAAIVNSSDDAIISKTLQGIITSWNQSACKMFGYTEKEAIGKHISLIIPKDRLDEETLIIESIRAGRKIDHFETVRVAKDGTERQISLTVSPVKDSKGKIIGASKIARDISSKIEAEKQRELYTQRLQELNLHRDDFIVMTSHELKTPLTVILANLQILQQLMEADKNVSFVNTSLKQILKLSALVSNLLDVSKIQSGKLELNTSLFNLEMLVKEIVINLQKTAKNHRLVFKDKAQKLIVNADHGRIEQVIINFISNAIKYMPSSGDIIIETYKNNGNVILSVRDTGIGIPEKDLNNIFLRFYRVSGSASSFSGSGIGLFVSSEIIKAHSGRIWAESKMGEGSVFYFSIPAWNEEA
ncbi:MAG TPA: PAS domain S-box protein [Hanamia sp.]|nr:PAS domain S-box protein [Hanamia sp.]